jgi:hypothetical protein
MQAYGSINLSVRWLKAAPKSYSGQPFHRGDLGMLRCGRALFGRDGGCQRVCKTSKRLLQDLSLPLRLREVGAEKKDFQTFS